MNQNGRIMPLKKTWRPPPHAPAHGYRSKYRYKYYPDTSVYFNSSKGLYFYLKGDSWTMSASLPDYLNVNLGSCCKYRDGYG